MSDCILIASGPSQCNYLCNLTVRPRLVELPNSLTSNVLIDLSPVLIGYSVSGFRVGLVGLLSLK